MSQQNKPKKKFVIPEMELVLNEAADVIVTSGGGGGGGSCFYIQNAGESTIYIHHNCGMANEINGRWSLNDCGNAHW